MMRGIAGIVFYDFQKGVPAFLTIILMPLTFSNANGLAFGFIAYTLILICRSGFKQCDPFLLAAAAFSILNFCL